MSGAVVERLTIHRLVIPLRRRVSCASSEWGVSEPVIVLVELRDGTIGCGEALIRSSAWGETTDSITECLAEDSTAGLVESVAAFHPDTFPEALEAIEQLPRVDHQGRPNPAARGAVELALLDASMRYFDRRMDDVVSWMGLPSFGTPGSRVNFRFSVAISSSGIDETLRDLRHFRWRGIRNFKLLISGISDLDRFRQVARRLERGIRKGNLSLRVDAAGAWTFEEAEEWLQELDPWPLAAIEDPLRREEADRFPELQERTETPLIHDVTVATADDAKELIDGGSPAGFTIRFGKSGGLLEALRIAELAHRHRLSIDLGAVPGETSISSAAGLRMLEVCPNVVWAEGCMGTHFLSEDVTTRSLRMRRGGRPPRLKDGGLGVAVDRGRLDKLGVEAAREVRF